MGRLAGFVRRLVFEPAKVRPGVVMGIALLPPVAAGLILFGLPAAEDLGIAVGSGTIVHLILRLFRRRPATGPVVVAVAGVGLAGPGAPLWWIAVVATAACLLEVGRTLVPGRPLPVHTGLWAYAAVYLAGRGRLADYLAPGRSARSFPEPIRLWHDFFGGSAAPLDPVTLYVGNVAGPVFATSLLAIVVGAAWLWYGKRLDLMPLIGIALGGIAVTVVEGWNLGYQLLSGPLWFAAVYCVADRRLLPGPPLLDGLLGALAGFIGVGLRTRGLAVEAAPVTFAAVQLAVTVVVGAARAWRAWRPKPAIKKKAEATRPLAPGRQLK